LSGDLSQTDLVVDAIYGGKRYGNAKDDPLPELLDVDNGAGFRHLGKRNSIATLKLLVLKTNFKSAEWPDSIDRENGLFTYFGDQHSPGELHQTPRKGNVILRNLFDAAHSPIALENFPPILIFAGAGKGTHRDVRFLGLAVPGAEGFSADEDLIAVWRTTADNIRFQNYKAIFTILNVPVVTRAWIHDIQTGNALGSVHAPKPWLNWVKARHFDPLKSTPTQRVRSQLQQLPATTELKGYVEVIYNLYRENPIGFERCAMEIARIFMPNIHHWELTRPWRDGGRDALGTYRIGIGAGHVDVEFALEAKCHASTNGVGVKPLSRLISRLRHRQFGILVTTSFLSSQAYQELVDDNHPVVVISGADIAERMKERFGSLVLFRSWLDRII
jgi:hypothetical protein